MTDTAITKLEGARRLLDSAIQDSFAGRDSLSVHNDAADAFQVLFDLCEKRRGVRIAVDIIRDRIGPVEFNRVANFLKHADRYPNETLPGHSLKSVYLTLQFAILLYRANDGELTPHMLGFQQTPDPYLEGFMHKAAIEFFREHRHDFRLWSALNEEAERTWRADVGSVTTLASS